MCAPHVDRGRPSPACHEQPCGASVASPLPLLAQEVRQLVHELFRVKILITPWARRLITRRVIVVLSLPDIGLHGGVLRHGLVTLGAKGSHGLLEGSDIQLQVEQVRDRDQQCATCD